MQSHYSGIAGFTMSLNYITGNTKAEQENKQEPEKLRILEAAAEKFERVTGMKGNREGRNYLESLDKETAEYIKNNPKYGWIAEIVMRMRG